jgi:phage terminase small subunit
MRNLAPSLTARQLRWVDEFLVDSNATAAAVRAGYSERSARSIAHENMTKPALQAVLAERRGEVASRLQITREGVIQGLLDAVHLAREQANPAGMVAGLREIGKMLGYYAPEVRRVELSGDSRGVTSQLERLSDAELEAMVAGSVAH